MSEDREKLLHATLTAFRVRLAQIDERITEIEKGGREGKPPARKSPGRAGHWLGKKSRIRL